MILLSTKLIDLLFSPIFFSLLCRVVPFAIASNNAVLNQSYWFGGGLVNVIMYLLLKYMRRKEIWTCYGEDGSSFLHVVWAGAWVYLLTNT